MKKFQLSLQLQLTESEINNFTYSFNYS